MPFAAPLAILIFFLDLIPLVGATIGAVIVGVVTLFENFPTATIVWIIWSIVYQQLENNLVQPQIQKRAVNVQPFVVIVAVLFGGTLLGVLGAIVAVPVAATIQIAAREYSVVKRLLRAEDQPAIATVARTRRSAAPEQRDGGGDAAADEEARRGRADQRRRAVLRQLTAPVGELGDLRAQVVDREPQLAAGGLDLGADLL